MKCARTTRRAAAAAFAALAAALMMTACAPGEDHAAVTGPAQATPNASVKPDSRVEIAVQGMSCSGCENSIREALQKLDGISSASASATAGVALAEFDSKTVSPADMAAAISKLGYTATDDGSTVTTGGF